MLTYIEEQKFFNCLTWLHHVLSGVFVSVLVGENLPKLGEHHTSMFFYSSCSKIPVLWEEFSGLFFYNLFVISHLAIVSIGFGIQIAVFVKQKQLEKQQADGIIIETYNMDDVTISDRTPHHQSSHKLRRHNRTVLTPKASFSSFLLSVTIIILNAYFFFNIGPSGPPILVEFLIFSTVSVYFFLYNFIATICSPILRNSLIDIIPCRKRKYSVVNV